MYCSMPWDAIYCITNSSITNGQEGYSRSVGPGGGALIGSHCN